MRFRGKPAFIILFNHEIDDSKKAYQHGSLNRWLVVWCASKRMTLSYLQVSVEPVTDGSTLVLLWRFEWEVCICSEVWQAIVQWWHIVLHISCKNIEIISIETDGNTLSSFKPRTLWVVLSFLLVQWGDNFNYYNSRSQQCCNIYQSHCFPTRS